MKCEGKILYFLRFDLIFVSSLDSFEILWKANEIRDANLREMSYLILNAFLLHPNSGKYNCFKLAVFALKFSYLLMYKKNLKLRVCEEDFNSEILLKDL